MPSTGLAARTALAWVSFSFGAYLGLERKVRWPGPACSRPRTPVISRSAVFSMEPHTVQPNAAASSLIFMVKHKGTPGVECGRGGEVVLRRGLQSRTRGGDFHS